MTHFRFSEVAIIFCLWLLFLNLPFSSGQDVSLIFAAENESGIESFEPVTIKLNVSEVRLDVVVLNGNGRPITDLTADDFEVYQNRLPQEVTSGVYISNQMDVTAQPSASRKDSPNLPKLPDKTLKEEDVRRTILFVVDNLSIAEFAQLNYAKTAIKTFTEKQMQPGDMVAVMRTSHGNSALDFFSSDKRQITARTDGIPYGFVGINTLEIMLHRVYSSQLSTISYGIRALKGMPGRKFIFFLTDNPRLYVPPPFSPLPNFSNIYGPRFEDLANDALRSGVVVYQFDVKGLEIDGGEGNFDANNPLPAKTGGTLVENSNFFVDGIGKNVNNMITGYYLVSYVPPPTTFNLNRRDVYHRVEVRVKRKGAVVYTRDGFYGRTESEMDAAAPPAHPLQDAIFSPFKYADLGVNMAAGYVKDAKSGYLVRSWIHLDPKDVKIVEMEDGGVKIDLETVCLTSDISGNVHDFVHYNYTLSLAPEKKSENLAWIQKHGIRFSLLLPVKKPGAYAVRIAVLDAESGRIGSAWQAIEISDLGRKGLILSNIFMITGADDLNWMRSDVTEGVFSLMFQDEDVRSPALRTYTVGDALHALAILYNTDAKSISRSEIETQSVLYKDGKEFLRGKSSPLNPANAANPDGIPILWRLTLGPNPTPGDYALQLLVIDKRKSKKNEVVASETLSFTVIGE